MDTCQPIFLSHFSFPLIWFSSNQSSSSYPSLFIFWKMMILFHEVFDKYKDEKGICICQNVTIYDCALHANSMHVRIVIVIVQMGNWAKS